MMFMLLAVQHAFSAARGRVKIQNGNVVTDTGAPLRGAPFFMGIFDVPDMKANETLYRNYFREVSQKYHMNTVRLGLWVGDWSFLIKGSQWDDHHKQ